MKKVRIEDAIGQPICHDMTRIVPGQFKGVAFKRGHIITEEDIPRLKQIGKEHVYVGQLPEGYIHEDDCAVRIAKAICNEKDFDFSEVAEGKINISTKYDGVLRIKEEKLYKLNSIKDISISTTFPDIVVRKGKKIASERIIPLYTKEKHIEILEEICNSEKLFFVEKFTKLNVHLIITGNEVYKGLIKDKFYDALLPKVKSYGCEIVKVVKSPDDKDRIKSEIERSIKENADVILCTGGMSVDEDDLTPISIKEVADETIVHGIPVQPGNMFLLAYKNNIPIMGLPGSVMFHGTTIFDIVFPRIACKEKFNKDFFIKLGLGGLCEFCSTCHYPNCNFGKGR